MNDLSGLRIAFLAGTLGRGGSERQLFYILKTLRQYGCRPTLFTLLKNEFWEQKIRNLDIPVIWIGQHDFPIFRLITFTKKIHKLNVDIVQSQHFYTNIYTAIAGRITRTVDIGAVRNDVFSEIKENGRLFGPMCLELPRFLAANSENGKSNALSKGIPANKLRYLPNVIDCDLFVPPVTPKDTGITFLTIGRLTLQKNQKLLLDALAKLLLLTPMRVRGVIVGTGEEKEMLEKRAFQLGLSPGVISFIDHVADPLTLYHSSLAFVLTSNWEGTPNVILEAMACGLPVISTSVGEVPDLIQDNQSGLLVERGNLDMLVQKMLHVINHPEIRVSLGENAREFIVKNRSLARLPEILRNFYASFG